LEGGVYRKYEGLDTLVVMHSQIRSHELLFKGLGIYGTNERDCSENYRIIPTDTHYPNTTSATPDAINTLILDLIRTPSLLAAPPAPPTSIPPGPYAVVVGYPCDGTPATPKSDASDLERKTVIPVYV
jgi:hypothetical protein